MYFASKSVSIVSSSTTQMSNSSIPKYTIWKGWRKESLTNFLTRSRKRLYDMAFGHIIKIGTLNMCGGISGEADEASSTEFKGDAGHIHKKLLDPWLQAELINFTGLEKCLNVALAAKYTPQEVKKLIREFQDFDGPIHKFFKPEHLKKDNKPDRPKNPPGSDSNTDISTAEMYARHCSEDVISCYTGEKAGLWLFDAMGILLREIDYDTFKEIVEASPLTGITSLMTTSLLLNQVDDATFILVQEMPRGDDIDNLLRILGWSIIRHDESTAFLYKTGAIFNGEHPIPMKYNSKKQILSPSEFYESEEYKGIQFTTIKMLSEECERLSTKLEQHQEYMSRLVSVKESNTESDDTFIDTEFADATEECVTISKLISDIETTLKQPEFIKTAEKHKKELEVIEKATMRIQLLQCGPLKFANIHWTQPKTDDGYRFQHAYFLYLIKNEFFIAGDTNTSSKKIQMQLDSPLGECIFGKEIAKEPTSKKERSELPTHGQFLDRKKAGVSVNDPKSHLYGPLWMHQFHEETMIISDGPPGTTKWPSDHMGKCSVFRGINFNSQYY